MLLEEVSEIVARQLGAAVEDVNAHTRLAEDLEADSLDMVQVVMDLEQSFDMEIPDTDFRKLATVNDIVHYIEKKRARNG